MATANIKIEIANGYTLRTRSGDWELVTPYGVKILGSVRFNTEDQARRRAMVELARPEY